MRKVIVLIGCLMVIRGAMGAGEFSREFAPSDGWVKPQEAPCRGEICLNGAWHFQPVAIPRDFKRDTGEAPVLAMPAGDRWETTPIRIPSPWNVNAWGNGRHVGEGTEHRYRPDSVYYPSYPESWDPVEMGWLRRTFRVARDWDSKRVLIHFEAVAGDCQVWINGTLAGRHFDRFLPFEIDITGLVNRDGENELLVGVRHPRLFNKTSEKYPYFRTTYPPGSELDRIVGIWQDVYLLGVPKVRVCDTFVQPLVDRDVLQVDVTVRNDTEQVQEITVGGTVFPWINLAPRDGVEAAEPKWKLGEAAMSVPDQHGTIKPGEKVTIRLSGPVRQGLRLWNAASPSLYAMIASIKVGEVEIDRHFTRFGWRQWTIRGQDLLLNGQRVQMVGDLSHPFGPFMMSRRFAWSWYRMIKDFGGNAVRPHAQPYPRAYLDLADEMGILVLDETSLFGSSIQLNFEEPAAWRRFNEHFRDLILRDRNHPGVFGWSFGNELFAIFNLNKITGDEADTCYRRLTEMGLQARTIDPTRPWISCDGDEDLRGTLPVWSKHFGHGLSPLPEVNKPRMIGESGGTYYATPGQLSVFNGDRAYESYAGRNEALAIDLYQNVVKMARPKLTYFSPSEMVWFGIEHLPLGFKDFARLPTLADGIFFKRFEEGKPGMQLERIPPYVTTLNPGYDVDLPQYRPLAMFEAMKAAMAADGPMPCAWDRVTTRIRHAAPPPPGIEKVALAGTGSAELRRKLRAWGVPLAEGNDAADVGFLIIDGGNLTEAVDEIRRQADAVRSRGGVVLILLRKPPENAELLNRLLPAPVQVLGREATALALKSEDARLANLSAEDLYFAELEGDRHVVQCAMAGPMVDRGRVLLEASNTDWSQFNRVAEVAKCGAVVMYEQHRKPANAALVEFVDGGRTLVSTIDFQPQSEKYARFWRDLLGRLGVKMRAMQVKWVLPIATIAEKPIAWRYTFDAPPQDWNQPDFNDNAWRSGEGGFGTGVPAGKVGTRWTSSDVWLRRQLDLPGGATGDLKMLLHHDEDVEVYINGTLICRRMGHVTRYEPIALTAEMRKAFRRGGNTLAVHCRQTAGGQYVDVGFLEGFVPEDVTADGKVRDHNLLLDGPTGK